MLVIHAQSSVSSTVLAYVQDKCEKYWPSAPNEPWDVGHSLMVTLSEQIPFAEYKVKIMKVENVR